MLVHPGFSCHHCNALLDCLGISSTTGLVAYRSLGPVPSEHYYCMACAVELAGGVLPPGHDAGYVCPRCRRGLHATNVFVQARWLDSFNTSSGFRWYYLGLPVPRVFLLTDRLGVTVLVHRTDAGEVIPAEVYQLAADMGVSPATIRCRCNHCGG